ncbi:MAG: phosphate ABC transporter permease PstA [Synechococcales cyanobacterium]
MSTSPISHPSVSDTDASLIFQPLSFNRTFFSRGMTGLAFVLSGLAILPLFSILFEVIKNGLPQLTLDTFTQLPAPAGMEGIPDGFANCIIGTLMMVFLASLMSIPIGILAAIYLSEFGQGSTIGSGIRFLITVLSGVPSIVVGLFAYTVIVFTTKTFSGLAGSFALAIVMVPIITLSTLEALKLVPTAQRLASSALGANRFQTTFKIVVSSALPVITTGTLLAISRAIGETAPLIFTALFTINWPDGFFQPTPSLSVMIYNYAGSPFTEQNAMAWTGALVLVFIVLCINIFSRLVLAKTR